MSDECREPYRECVRSRQERVRRVIEENPAATSWEIAERAGVSERTARNEIKRRETVESFPQEPEVKLKDLYDPGVIYMDHPAVRTIELALERCSRPELAYLFCEVFPIFEHALKRRMTRDDRNERKLAANGAAYEDQATNDAVGH